MKIKKWVLGASALGLLALGLLLYVKSFKPEPYYKTVEEINQVGAASGLTDCFWIAALGKGKGFNYAYPDTGANYWISQFQLPAGARLELSGAFPHARHMSFNSYDDSGQPVDRLNDVMLVPEGGSSNPYLPGARRDAAQRQYRIQVASADIHAGAPMAERDAVRPQNTLFVPIDSKRVQLFLRNYVPDTGYDAKAGVELPKPRLRLADDSVVEGDALCKAIVIKEQSLRDIHLSKQSAQTLLSIQSSTTPYHPAQPEPKWRAFLNPPMTLAGTLEGTAFEWVKNLISHQRKGGFYSTLDNTYMVASVDNRFGELLELRGKAPSTPRTLKGDAIMQAAQLRYWSVCKYRSLYDTAVDDCLYDEQVPLNTAGEYTIVFSTPEMRPANATEACGVAWRPWGVGDGLDNPHGGLLVYRHMLPAADFTQSIFATKDIGEEKTVLGPYYPRSAYQSKAAFEARGCPLQR